MLRSELIVAKIGVGVVPGHELGGGKAALQIFAGDVELPVRLRPDCVDDLVVVRFQVGMGNVVTELYIAEVAHAAVLNRAFIDARHGLYLLVIRSHPVAHEAVGSGQPVEYIDRHMRIFLLQQRAGTVETGRSGADDRNLHRSAAAAEFACRDQRNLPLCLVLAFEPRSGNGVYTLR